MVSEEAGPAVALVRAHSVLADAVHTRVAHLTLVQVIGAVAACHRARAASEVMHAALREQCKQSVYTEQNAELLSGHRAESCPGD